MSPLTTLLLLNLPRPMQRCLVLTAEKIVRETFPTPTAITPKVAEDHLE